MLFEQLNNILPKSLVKESICKIITRNYKREPFSYGYRYRGGFDYHDTERYPHRFPIYKEEELLDEVHAIKNMTIDNPSPFHVVRRIKDMKGLPWNQKVTLRRLNLHSTLNGESAVIPNTPQFNNMLMKVKHVLSLKPAIFEDGRIPSEEDIGAIRVCPFTGKIKIDEKLRLLAKRVNIEKPPLFQGKFLRYKLGRIYGITSNAPTIVKI